MPIKKASDIKALTEARLNIALRPFVGQPLTEQLISQMQKQANDVSKQMADEYQIERPLIHIQRNAEHTDRLRIVIE